MKLGQEVIANYRLQKKETNGFGVKRTEYIRVERDIKGIFIGYRTIKNTTYDEHQVLTVDKSFKVALVVLDLYTNPVKVSIDDLIPACTPPHLLA